MNEKLIVISTDGEILDSFVGTVGYLSEYSVNNKIELINIIEFEAFVFVDVEFK